MLTSLTLESKFLYSFISQKWDSLLDKHKFLYLINVYVNRWSLFAFFLWPKGSFLHIRPQWVAYRTEPKSIPSKALLLICAKYIWKLMIYKSQYHKVNNSVTKAQIFMNMIVMYYFENFLRDPCSHRHVRGVYTCVHVSSYTHIYGSSGPGRGKSWTNVTFWLKVWGCYGQRKAKIHTLSSPTILSYLLQYQNFKFQILGII